MEVLAAAFGAVARKMRALVPTKAPTWTSRLDESRFIFVPLVQGSRAEELRWVKSTLEYTKCDEWNGRATSSS